MTTPRDFTLEEADSAIRKLRRRIQEVDDLREGLGYADQAKTTAESNIRETIREVFGVRSPEFEEHEHHRIWHGGYNTGDTAGVLQAKFTAGIPQTIQMLEGLIARLEEKREDLNAGRAVGATSQSELHPWSVVAAFLFELDSDDVVEVVSRAGLEVDWQLTAKQGYSNRTRNREYRPRVDAAYSSLRDTQLAVESLIATDVATQLGDRANELRDRLGDIGWKLIGRVPDRRGGGDRGEDVVAE